MLLSGKIDQFIESQLTEWEMASANYRDLNKVRTKSLRYKDFEIKVQFNPKRIISSAAKVDSRSIEARPCFLCAQNRPPVQKGLPFNHRFSVLINPFPIFPKHLTVPVEEHTNQLIAGHFNDMLDLAAALPDFVVFYNGPKCGASAPDHFHFQAGSKGFLPIEKDFHNRELCRPQSVINDVTVYTWNHYLRGIITLQGRSQDAVAGIFESISGNLKQLQPQESEPMMNILAYVSGQYRIVHIIPRVLHRPRQYFETGDGQILLSPASVDMGGVFITPREEDFEKIKEDDVRDILAQVCMDNEGIQRLLDYEIQRLS